MSVVLYARMHNIILRLVCVYIQEVYYSIYYAYYERSMSIYYYIIYELVCILYELIILCILRA